MEPFLKDIYTIEREEYSSIYYVLWVGDIGCAGGTGTTSFHVTEVSRTGGAGFFVQDHNAFGNDPSITFNYRTLQSLQKIHPNKFVLENMEYDEKDSNCCPSLRYEYTLERNGSYSSWKQTGKVFLGKEK